MSPAKRHHFFLAIRHWHRRIGLVAALFAVLLAVTGIMLNHTENLKLDSRHVHSTMLLDWYGIKAPVQSLSYVAGEHWISQLGDRLYFDKRELPHKTGRLVGVVALQDRIIVAVGSNILLLTVAGDLLETVSGAEGVPAGIRDIGVKDTGLVVRASHGDYLSDKDALDWQESEQDGDVHKPVEGVVWAKPAPLPPVLYDQLAEAYRGQDLSVERVLLDLHSGRFWGWGGVWFMDAIAILITLLALSGVWMWLRLVRREHH